MELVAQICAFRLDGAPHLPDFGRCGFSPAGDILPGVPYGLNRYQQSKQCHFVTFSCYRRLPHLRDGRLCDLFVKCLERTRSKYRFRVYGYVVMPEHVHLLVSEPELEVLAKAIQALKISVL